MEIKILRKILLLLLLAIELVTTTTKNVEVIRDFTRDYLYCPNKVNCPNYDSQQLAPMECGCHGGSFVRDGNLLKCKKNIQNNKGIFKKIII